MRTALLVSALVAGAAHAQVDNADADNTVPAAVAADGDQATTWHSNATLPDITFTPIPEAVDGVATPVLDLGGDWHFAHEAPPDLARLLKQPDADNAPGTWPTVTLPGHFALQGYEPMGNDLGRAVAYHRAVDVPADWAGRPARLRFDSIDGLARLWVNGAAVASSDSAFLPVEFDVTAYLKPGETNTLTLTLENSELTLWYLRPMGGMGRPMRLFVADEPDPEASPQPLAAGSPPHQLPHIEVDGHTLRIDGEPVKLFGVNYHVTAPGHGHFPPPDIIRRDLKLLKDAGINAIRFWPTPYLDAVEACAELGLWCTIEVPLNLQLYAPGHRKDHGNNPALRDAYLALVARTVATYRDQPAVIAWGLGNECIPHGYFKDAAAALKKAGVTRPVFFGGDQRMGVNFPGADLHDEHYPRDGVASFTDLGRIDGPGWSFPPDRPAISTEWCHLHVNNRNQIALDPGIDDYWGFYIAAHAEWTRRTPNFLGGFVFLSMPYHAVDDDKRWRGLFDDHRRPTTYLHHLRSAYTDAPRATPTAEPGPLERQITDADAADLQRFLGADGVPQVVVRGNGVPGEGRDFAPLANLLTLQSATRRGDGMPAVWDVVYDHAEGTLTARPRPDGSVECSYDLAWTWDTPKPIRAFTVGIGLTVPARFDTLRWERDALWQDYPDDHIGRPRGTAHAAADPDHAFGDTPPDRPWSQDRIGGVTRDFRSSKFDLRAGGLFADGGRGDGVSVMPLKRTRPSRQHLHAYPVDPDNPDAGFRLVLNQFHNGGTEFHLRKSIRFDELLLEPGTRLRGGAVFKATHP